MSQSPLCTYQPACPGCSRYQQLGLSPQVEEQINKLAEDFGLPHAEIVATPGEGYRHRVRLSVRGRPGQIGIGIFEAKSHRLVSIIDCPVHHPKIQLALREFERGLNREKIEAYDEGRHRGLLRTIQLVAPQGEGGLQIVFVANSSLQSPSRPLGTLRRLLSAWAEEDWVHSIWLNQQSEKTNTLLGTKFERVAGPALLEDEQGGAQTFYPPGAFGQANPVLHEEAIRRIHSSVLGGSRIVEYYAGVGTIGLGLLKQGREVVFNEVGGDSLEGLRQGLASLDATSRTRVLNGVAGEFAEEYSPEDVVIVDPPRKGLDKALMARLIANPPRQLIYLSCGFEALQRECEAFKEAGLLQMKQLTGFTYFPYTDHVETLAVFERGAEAAPERGK